MSIPDLFFLARGESLRLETPEPAQVRWLIDPPSWGEPTSEWWRFLERLQELEQNCIVVGAAAFEAECVLAMRMNEADGRTAGPIIPKFS